MTVRLVQETASRDLDEILDFLEAEADGPVALRYAVAFQSAFYRITKFPQLGAPRPKLGSDTRLVIVQPYLIFYDHLVAQDHVHVLRILHERRNITAQLLKP